MIQTKSFIFRIDTILKTIYQNRVKTDTIKIEYSFPENIYSLGVHSKPDSIFNEIKSITKTLQEKSLFEKFFENYIWYLISGIIIVIISYLIIIKK